MLSGRLRALWMITILIMMLYIPRKIYRILKLESLREEGFRLCDISIQLYEIAQEMGASPTVSGFEVCPDTLTVENAKEIGRGLMRSFINLRSQIHKIGDEWYYKETFDPETEDMNQYITYVPMEANCNLADESESEIEEILLQQSLDYLNDGGHFNVKWNLYDRGHFDAIYFHFKAQKKVILFFRFDHSLCDGILMSTLINLIHHQLFDPVHQSEGNKAIDFTKEDELLPLLSKVMGKGTEPISLSQRMLHYMHLPVALLSFCTYNVLSVIRPDSKCAFRGEFEPRNKLALSRPIELSQFKSVAHYNGHYTVNDLFLALSIGALRRYGMKSGCPIFNDPDFEGVFSKLSVVNRRPLEPKAFAKELKKFAEKGTNANALDFTPFRVNVKQINLQKAQSAFRPIKEGYSANVFRSAVDAMGGVPGGRKAMVTLNQIISMCSSNLRGPTELIPIPGETPGTNNYVSWYFGIAIPGPLPVNFGLVSYGTSVRIGAIVNTGSIQDPKLLMQYWMEEWKQYAEASIRSDQDAELT